MGIFRRRDTQPKRVEAVGVLGESCCLAVAESLAADSSRCPSRLYTRRICIASPSKDSQTRALCGLLARPADNPTLGKIYTCALEQCRNPCLCYGECIRCSHQPLGGPRRATLIVGSRRRVAQVDNSRIVSIQNELMHVLPPQVESIVGFLAPICANASRALT